MFNRTTISKRIGWDLSKCDLPSMAEVKKLVSKMEEGDEEAAVQIFKYYRFGKSPENDEQTEIMNIICRAMMMIK